MSHEVFLEQIDTNHYQATSLMFPNCAAVGTSRDEALEKVRCEIRTRLGKGEVVTVEIDEPGHPLLKFAGMWKDDPTFDDFVAEMAAYRRDVDEAERLNADPSP